MAPTQKELKEERSKKKAAITRLATKVDRFVAESEPEKVTQSLQNLKDEMGEFEKIHDSYHATCDATEDYTQSSEYADEVEQKYIEAYKTGSEWLKSLVKGDGKQDSSMDESLLNQSAISPEIVNLLNLPKMELFVYDGSPLMYYPFVTTFDETVDVPGVSDSVKLNRLIKYTSGEANRSISSALVIGGEKGYSMARDTLRRRFGNDLIISQAIINSLKDGPEIKSAAELRRLGDDLFNGYNILSKLRCTVEVESQSFIASVVDKLQYHLKGKWRKMAMTRRDRDGSYPGFGHLVDFVQSEANNASDPVYGEAGLLKFNRRPNFNQQQPASGGSSQKARPSGNSFITSEGRKSVPCLMCGDVHRLYMCDSFKALRPDQKLTFIKDKAICENCLLYNHVVASCYRPSMCGIDGCEGKHSRYIHRCKTSTSDQSQPTIGDSKFSAFTQAESKVCIPVVKVKVNNKCDCNVMLDSCSTSTFMSSKLAKSLGLSGIPIKYELSTLTSKAETKESRLIPNLCVESIEGQSINLENVYVIESIPASRTSINVDKFSHLHDINVVSSCDRVDILVGQDNAEVLIPLDVRKGGKNEPFAVRTVLGWSLHGNTGRSDITDVCGLVSAGKVSHKVVSNFIKSDISRLNDIEEQVDRLWNIECEGLASDDRKMSCADGKVLELWDKHIDIVDGHYELPIPWKDGVHVPNNYELARSRLKSLRSSLVKRGLLDKYEFEVQKLLDKGYAERVVVEEIQNSSSKTWYLPHHAVISDKKPGKLRVVFDCAACYKGESLNDKCHQGPDLNNKLLHVLLRFRQHQLAIMADVEAMYYQVKVKGEDKDALRFLWMEDGKEVTYRMKAHIFGGIWCACVATYAMRRTVKDQGIQDEFVEETINKAFYVDDCLKSVKKREDGEKIVKEVKDVLKEGGFNLTKFVTNDEILLQEIDEEDRAKEVKEFNKEVISKALGVRWDVKEDTLKVEVSTTEDEVITRRRMLSTIATMYDPLGIVSPCIITAKLMFQEASKLKLEWDEEVPAGISRRWREWIQSLHGLNQAAIPRCLVPTNNGKGRYEVHNFCDASESGYGCCSYLKVIDDDEIHTTLIMSRARVSPMKHVSLPRLELQAALMATQMNEVIQKEMELEISLTRYYTDSQIVLAYIQNTQKRLKTFVANRVSQIHCQSKASEWRFIPGKKNPADMMTRGMSPAELMKNNIWIEGPKMLRDENEEEKKVEVEIPDEDIELKKVTTHGTVLEEEVTTSPVEEIINHHSSWYRVKKSIAWILKIRERLLNKDKKRRKEEVTVEEMKKAEILVIKHVQQMKYEREIKGLKNNNKVPKSSSIRSLLPILNKDEILCVGGRLKYMKKANINNIHQYIIPHDHPVARLIVREQHNKAHQGTEWTLSLLREKFWITRARGLIKQIRKACTMCKRWFDLPQKQQMANLPEERLQKASPFKHVGIDCFGPFYVKQGRAEVKRYGCIFTCMNIRAVHLEKLNTLETDSFINGFRRFMMRRGTPAKVWSDNGTNFVGGSPELMKCLQQLDEDKIKEFGLKEEVEWKFNPPHASHMGGVWERQIRTVRKILTGILNKHTHGLTDEVLETVFCEVEGMINSRPLTKLSDDVTDMSTLSPNQLLLLNEAPRSFPGNYHKYDVYKLRWKFIQYLANQFWKRWTKEYLPELQKRVKWENPEENIKIGDVVLLLEENTPRFLWPMAIVIEVKQGRDKLVRSVKVRTKSTILTRPISKLVKIEGGE